MRYCFLSLLLFWTWFLSGQDLIYTVTAHSGDDISPLDSILVENISNDTRIVFGNLPPRRDYMINLTQRAFWGTTGTAMIREAGFRMVHNQPGLVTITTGEAVSGLGSISVFNLLGQKLLEEQHLQFSPYHAFSLKIGKAGYFLVKVVCNGEAGAFKVQGSSSTGMISLTRQDGDKETAVLKKGTPADMDDFQFLPGDSIRISVYRKSFYSYPESFRIHQSDELDFWLMNNSAASTGISNAYISLYGNYSLESFDMEGGTAVLSPIGNGQPLKYGNIFVAESDSGGFLRKVISVAFKDGKYTVKTIPAALNEVFVNKELKMSTIWMDPLFPVTETSSPADLSRALTDAGGMAHPVAYVYQPEGGPKEIRSPLKFPGSDKPLFPSVHISKDIDKAILFAGSQVQVSLENGNLFLSQEGDLAFRFRSKGRIDPVTKSDLGEAEWGRASISGGGKVKSDVSFSASGASDIDLPAQKVMPTQKVSIKFLIEGIPLWVDLLVDLNQRMVMQSKGIVNAKWNFDQSYSFGNGWEYSAEKGIFTPLITCSSDNRSQPLSISGNSDLHVLLSVYPTTAFLIFGTPLMSAQYSPYTELSHFAQNQQVSTASGLKDFTAWNSLLKEGSNLRTSGGLQSAGLPEAKFDSGIKDCSWNTRWTSPVKLSMQPLDPGKVHLSSLINLNFKVTDSRGLPVPGCAVFIGGDGSFRDQLLYSNTSGEVIFEWTVGSKPGMNDFTAQIFNAVKEVISFVRDSVEVYDKDAYGTITYDGKSYKTKKFGNAIWMVENLAYLPSVTPPTPGSNSEPYYYVAGYYGTSTAEAKQVPGYALYGVMYNWKAATKGETAPSGGTIRGICPQGWHMPGEQDWADLWSYLVNNGYGFGGSGNRIAKAMASQTGWNSSSYSGTPGNDPGSNNSSEFNGLAGGFRCTDALDFVQKGMFASWWNAAPRDEINGYHWGFNYNTSQLIKYYSPKGRGYFVRCVRD